MYKCIQNADDMMADYKCCKKSSKEFYFYQHIHGGLQYNINMNCLSRHGGMDQSG